MRTLQHRRSVLIVDGSNLVVRVAGRLELLAPSALTRIQSFWDIKKTPAACSRAIAEVFKAEALKELD